MPTGYIAIPIRRPLRRELQQKISPRYPERRGDHITLKFDVEQNSPEERQWLEQFRDAAIEIYGVADDDYAVQCLLARVNGNRCDASGRPYHITWSLDPEKTAPAGYDSDPGPVLIQSHHSIYVAKQENFIRLWEPADIIRFRTDAKFYRRNGASGHAVS